jgi:hypothetical protein
VLLIMCEQNKFENNDFDLIFTLDCTQISAQNVEVYEFEPRTGESIKLI